MQTTLLGLAIAIILALVSAIVAPLVVDWNQYRAALQTEVSRLTGLNVRINGTIEARLLPSPVVTLHDVNVGQTGQKPQLRAGMLKLELALGPLLSGQVQASEVRLIAPQFTLGVDRAGAVDVLGLPPSLRPKALSISHLEVEDGRVTLADAASGARLVLQKLRFNGDIGALGGSFSGEGAAAVGAALYDYRISGAPDNKGGIKIRLGIDPTNRPLTTEFNGTLTFVQGVPHIAGTLGLARPVGATLANGQRVLSVPWRATGAIKATPAAAAITQIAFRYGPEERALNLTGSADLKFGEHPSLTGKMAALQLDVDRALAAPDLTYRPPLVAIRSFLQAFVRAATLPMRAQVSLDIDALTVGGTTIEALHGGLDYDGASWRVDSLQFHAPGMTDMTLSGVLSGVAERFSFDGRARLASADAGGLLAWIDGRGGGRVSTHPRMLNAQGNLTIASDRMAVDRLSATLDQESIAGRLAYDWPQTNRPARLDAELQADALDLDSLPNFATRALDQRGFTLPQEATIALEIGKIRFAGVDAQAVNARVNVTAGQLQINTLSIGALGGAKLALSGRIDSFSSRPSGQLTLDLNAGALDGLSAIAARFAPQDANAMHRIAAQLVPAALHAVLDVKPAPTSGSTATLHVDGNAATMQIAADLTASGEAAHAEAADIKLDGRLDADDGTVLVRLLGLDRVLAVDQLPGRLAFSATGPLNGDLQVDGRLAASGLGASAEGRLRLAGAAAPIGALQVSVAAADLRPLQQAMTGQAGAAIPVSGRGALAIDGTKLSLTNLAATVGTDSLQGHATIDLIDPIRIGGAIAAEKADAATVMGLLLGWPRATGADAGWSARAIGAGAFAPIKGEVNFTIGSAALTPSLVATGLKGVLHLGGSTIAVDDIDGSLALGHLSGGLSFDRTAGGLAARVHLNLAGASAAAMLAQGFGVSGGRLTVAVQSDGFGASPLSLIGSLHGSGTMALANAQFAGLDLNAFDAAIAAVGDSAPIDLGHVRTAVNAVLAKGHVEVPQGNVAVAITSGAASVNGVHLTTKHGGELAIDGAIDLSNQTVGARMTLSEPPPPHALIATRPALSVAIKGSLAAPQRVLDISTLSTWLTLRGAELQTRRIESIEAVQHEAVAGQGSHVGSPEAHLVEPGTVVELAIPPNLLPAPGSQVREIERLQPDAPPAAPAQNRASAEANGPTPTVVAPAPLEGKPNRAPVGGAPNAGALAPTARRPAPGLIGTQP